MRVAGVFVGVSSQADPLVPALGFADRDARRLHAVFADANVLADVSPDLLYLLVNEAATLVGVRAALHSAGQSVRNGEADLLAIHFSCHGTPQGQLVLHDTEHDQADRTSLPLHEIAGAVADVPAAQVVVTLDTCFSGTVVGQPGSMNREAFNGMMLDLSGEGRLVAWAAGPEEKAYESARYAHGHFSYALASGIDALRASGRTSVPVGDWVLAAVTHAAELARETGRAQTPSAHVRAGTALLHVPPVGQHQRRFAQEVGITEVEPALSSLARTYGFTDTEVAAIQARLARPDATLNELQRHAIAPAGLLVGRSVMVRAPTSAGKTLVGELALIHQRRFGRKSIVLLPTRALVRQQAEMWKRHYASIHLNVIVSTGEVAGDDDLFRRNQYDVGVFTYEKFAALIGAQPNLLDQVGVVVLDELQMIEDGERGRIVELLLLRIRNHQRLHGGWPQLVLLCGDVSDLRRFEEWLGLQSVGPGERPIPLREGVYTADGVWRTKHPATRDEEVLQVRPTALRSRITRNDAERRAAIAVTLATHLVRAGRQVLLFATSKPQAIRLAEWLAEECGLPPVEEVAAALRDLPAGDRHRASERLLRVAERGTAFHVADLEENERRLIEAAFEDGRVRALTATTTLAMGVNSTTDAVLVADSSFWQGPNHAPLPLRVSEYRNMAGRAGRLVPGGPTEGAAYLIAADDYEATEVWDRYLNAQRTGLESSLSEETLEDLLLAVLHIRGEAGVQQLADDIGNTYWGYVSRVDPSWLPGIRRRLDEVANGLRRDGLISETVAPNLGLTRTGRVCATFALRADSARKVLHAADRLIAAGERIDDLFLLVLTQITEELDKLFMSRELRTGLAPERRGPLGNRPTVYEILVDRQYATVDEDRSVSDRICRLIGIIGWLQGRSLREVESLVAGPDEGPVLGRLRGAVDRTNDLVTAVSALLEAARPELGESLRAVLPTLRARLEVGGSAVAGKIHRLRLGLSRPRCLALVALGVIDEDSLVAAIADRRTEVEAVLTADGVADLERRLAEPRGRRRRRAPAEDQLLLDLIASLDQV